MRRFHLLLSVMLLGFLLGSCTSNRYASVLQDLENEDYEMAYERLKGTHPRDAYYNALLAESAYYLEEYDVFLDAVSRSIRQSDDHRDLLLYLMTKADIQLAELAYDQFEEENYSSARETIDLVLRVRYLLDWVRKPLGYRSLNNAELLEYAGEALVEQGMYSEASTRLVFLSGDSLRDLNSRERLAYVYFEMQRWERVNDLIGTILTPGEDTAPYDLLAKQLADENYRTDSVLVNYLSVMSDRKLIERPLMDTHLGSSFFLREQWDESRRRFDHVLETRPANRAEFLSLIGESYYLEGRYDSAAVSFQRALDTRRDPGILQYLALSELRRGNDETADSLFSEARAMLRSSQRDTISTLTGEVRSMPQAEDQP